MKRLTTSAAILLLILLLSSCGKQAPVLTGDSAMPGTEDESNEAVSPPEVSIPEPDESADETNGEQSSDPDDDKTQQPNEDFTYNLQTANLKPRAIQDPAVAENLSESTAVQINAADLINNEHVSQWMSASGWGPASGAILNSTTYVPLADFCNFFGYSFEQADNLITVRSADDSWIFTLESTTFYQNDVAASLVASATLINGQLMIPLTDIPETFGKHVWYQMRGGVLCVWITTLQLLDLDELQNDANYTADNEQFDGIFVLNEEGQTSRGVRLGDSYTKVLEAYGPPHGQTWNGRILYDITYSSAFTPNSGEGAMLLFYLNNGLVTRVEVVYPQ